MNRARLVGILSVVIAGMVAGACGSASKSASRSSTTTTSRVAKLHLASRELTSVPSAHDAGAASFPVRPTHYVLDAKLPDLGGSAVVWRMNAQSVNAAVVQRFAGVLGLAGTPVQTSGGWELQGTSAMLSFVVTDGNVAVSYASNAPNGAGGSTGSAGSAGTATSPSAVANDLPKAPPIPAPVPAPPPRSTTPNIDAPDAPAAPPVDVPSAADAASIARGLLDRLGVLAEQDWSTIVNDSAGVAVACAVGKPCPSVPPEVSARTVTFSAILNGTRVAGVAWSVTIGEHRRIESVTGEWATPGAIGSYPLRSTAAVFADLRHGTARYAGPQPMMAMSGAPAGEAPAIAPSPAARTIPTVTVHVTGVSLGLARWDAYDNGHPIVDLVPTYRFHARIDGGSTYDIEVLALAPGAVTFTNPVPTPETRPTRPAPASPPIAAKDVSPPSS
jgi:hypothetical protein